MRRCPRPLRVPIAALLLSAAIAAACGPRPDSVGNDGSVAALAQVPEPIADAFRHLDREVPAEDRDTLRATPPGEMVRYHMGLGMYVRNELGLWRGGPLQDWFRAKGVRHPDDMSGVLLEAYGLYLRGAPVNLDSIIAAIPPPPVEIPAPGKFEVVPPDSSAPSR